MSTESMRAPAPACVPRHYGADDFEIAGRIVRTARLREEWYEDVEEPKSLIDACRRTGGADLLTFWQRLPHVEAKYGYHLEWDAIAVLPISTFEQWYKDQINNKTRNLVVKSRKKGIVVRRAAFDDAFVRGMAAIFNETPIRQERPFHHYGKDVETVRREFSKYLFREDLLGAYLNDELVGFAMVADAGRYAMLGQIISMVRHRDKSPTNALIAAAVELCAEKGRPALVYALWPQGPLREFKRHNGFECVRLPRYYVPLSARGRIALKVGLHRKLADRLPESTVSRLKSLRAGFYDVWHRRPQAGGGAGGSA